MEFEYNYDYWTGLAGVNVGGKFGTDRQILWANQFELTMSKISAPTQPELAVPS